MQASRSDIIYRYWNSR